MSRQLSFAAGPGAHLPTTTLPQAGSGRCTPEVTPAAGQVPQPHALSDEQRERAIRDEGDKAMAAWQRSVDARKEARRHFAQMRELIAQRSAAQVARMEQERNLA